MPTKKTSKSKKSKSDLNQEFAFNSDYIIPITIKESNEKKLLKLITNESLNSSEKLKEIENLVNLGTNLAFNDYEALFKSFDNNEEDLASFILQKVPDQKEALGYTLVNACSFNRIDLISRLIELFEVDVNFSNSLALKNASLSGNLSSVLLLLNSGADIHAGDDQALINSRDSKLTQYLLKKGCNVNAQNGAAIIETVKRRNSFYYPNEDSLSVLKNLLDNGAHVSAQDNKAIELAASNWDLEILDLLLPKVTFPITDTSVLDNIKISKSILGRVYVFFRDLEPRDIYYYEYYKPFFSSIEGLKYLPTFKSSSPLILIEDIFKNITDLNMVITPINGRGKKYRLYLDFFKGFIKNLFLIPNDYQALKNIDNKVFYWVENYYNESMLSGSEYLSKLASLSLMSEEEVFDKLLLSKTYIV